MRSECDISFFRKPISDTLDMIGQSHYLMNNDNRRARFLHSRPCQVGLNRACLSVVCHHAMRFICHSFIFLSSGLQVVFPLTSATIEPRAWGSRIKPAW